MTNLPQGWAETSSIEPGWDDSLFLLRNILKDLSKDKKLIEQYKLFMRAESTYKVINKELSEDKSRILKAKLRRAFNKLPAPGEVTYLNELQFVLQTDRREPFYWSNPVSEGVFVDYLNQIELPHETLTEVLYPNSHSVQFDAGTLKYFAEDSDKPLCGITYLTAIDFASWYSKTARFQVSLPKANMVIDEIDDDVDGVSCWTRTKWRDKNNSRRDAWLMFGGEFYTAFIDGKKVGELPEAGESRLQIHLVTSVNNGKRIFLKKLKSEL